MNDNGPKVLIAITKGMVERGIEVLTGLTDENTKAEDATDAQIGIVLFTAIIPYLTVPGPLFSHWVTPQARVAVSNGYVRAIGKLNKKERVDYSTKKYPKKVLKKITLQSVMASLLRVARETIISIKKDKA